MKHGETMNGSGVAASVCICTYNGGARIGMVIEALAAQTQPLETWELLVVDNASTDGTGDSVNRLVKKMLGGSGRVVHEEQLGLSFARSKAAREARGEIVCFLDDDNVPAPDFVARAIRAFADRPTVGALGGKILPVWETPPNDLALAVQDFALAICDMGDSPFQLRRGTGPVGAGLCIRSKILQKIYVERSVAARVTGHQGRDVRGGDDFVVGILTWQLGYECWYEPSLRIQHLLPARRMEKDYLLQLYEGIGRGQAAVRRLNDWKARSPLAVIIAAKDIARWLKRSWGPSIADARTQNVQLARDLNDLEKRLILGRALAAIIP
jgi:glycosyltransferase involved in cell wall biosynthesis